MRRTLEGNGRQDSSGDSKMPKYDGLKIKFKEILEEQSQKDQIKALDESREFLMREVERYLSDMNQLSEKKATEEATKANLFAQPMPENPIARYRHQMALIQSQLQIEDYTYKMAIRNLENTYAHQYALYKAATKTDFTNKVDLKPYEMAYEQDQTQFDHDLYDKELEYVENQKQLNQKAKEVINTFIESVALNKEQKRDTLAVKSEIEQLISALDNRLLHLLKGTRDNYTDLDKMAEVEDRLDRDMTDLAPTSFQQPRVVGDLQVLEQRQRQVIELIKRHAAILEKEQAFFQKLERETREYKDTTQAFEDRYQTKIELEHHRFGRDPFGFKIIVNVRGAQENKPFYVAYGYPLEGALIVTMGLKREDRLVPGPQGTRPLHASEMIWHLRRKVIAEMRNRGIEASDNHLTILGAKDVVNRDAVVKLKPYIPSDGERSSAFSANSSDVYERLVLKETQLTQLGQRALMMLKDHKNDLGNKVIERVTLGPVVLSHVDNKSLNNQGLEDLNEKLDIVSADQGNQYISFNKIKYIMFYLADADPK